MPETLMDMTVDIGGATFKNPILVASGTFGHGLEAAPFVDLSKLGGIVGKSISLEPWDGNDPPRIFETPAGMLNSIGLQNPGIDEYVTTILPSLMDAGATVVCNIVERSVDGFKELARRLDGNDDITAIEANLSCPNVKGHIYCHDPELLRTTVEAIRGETSKPLWIKLSPNVTDIASLSIVAAEAGADALSVTNTFIGLAIDWRKRTPRLGGGTGGLSGPAIRPLSLRAVWQVAQAVEIPVIGIGGISSAEDVCEFICAGATAVQIGTASFVNPAIAGNIVQTLPNLLNEAGVPSLDELRGSVQLG